MPCLPQSSFEVTALLIHAGAMARARLESTNKWFTARRLGSAGASSLTTTMSAQIELPTTSDQHCAY
eukprot:8395115-Alexandrium_andersonii.AAC.1